MEGPIKVIKPVNENTLGSAMQRLQEYKRQKKTVDERIIENEQFWKMKQWEQEKTKEKVNPTAWLWNVIMSKHADMMDGYPEANVRPKEEGDKDEAKTLSSIVPVIFEENRFKTVYSKNSRQKLGSGTAVYGITWDKSKHNGQGDIAIHKVDILNLFWEPGITDIQKSKEVFHTALVDNELLEGRYPELAGRLGHSPLKVEEYIYDDNIDVSNKSLVVDWYYKKFQNGKTVLHYCKFVDNIVLYATENMTEPPTAPLIDINTGLPVPDSVTGEPLKRVVGESMAQKGLYDHGKYPFVFDVLFDVEGSPCGYGYIDICKGTQRDIDILNHSIVKNAMLASKPRFFIREDGSINADEFADYSNDFVKSKGNLGEDSIRQIEVPALPNIAVQILNNKIEELKDTSGNRDVNNGTTNAGVTAASAIAALQEAAGKTSRDMIAGTYEAFRDITYQVIELIRQFYDTKRQFRIVGEGGQDKFVSYDNSGIMPQNQGDMFGIPLGYRVPEFDIEVSAQKATPYSKMSQNELALQFYNAGLFNPQAADMALACLKMMDFAHKDEIINMVQENGTLQQQVTTLLQVAMGLAAKYDPQTAQQLAANFADLGAEDMFRAASEAAQAEMREQNPDGTIKGKEHPFVRRAREQAQASTQL